MYELKINFLKDREDKNSVSNNVEKKARPKSKITLLLLMSLGVLSLVLVVIVFDLSLPILQRDRTQESQESTLSFSSDAPDSSNEESKLLVQRKIVFEAGRTYSLDQKTYLDQATSIEFEKDTSELELIIETSGFRSTIPSPRSVRIPPNTRGLFIRNTGKKDVTVTLEFR